MSILLAPTLVQTFPKRPCRRASKGSICRGGSGRCAREVYVDDSDLFAGFANKIRNEGTRKVVRETTVDHQSSASSLPGPYMIKLDTHGYEVPFLHAGDGDLA
jgi:hypothetical protein